MQLRSTFGNQPASSLPSAIFARTLIWEGGGGSLDEPFTRKLYLQIENGHTRRAYFNDTAVSAP